METGNGNWRLETEVETEVETEMKTQPLSCCSPSKIHVLLAFVPLGIPEPSQPPVFDRLLC